MTTEEHAAWLEGVRRWARERAEREEGPREPLYIAWGDEVRDPVRGASFFAARGVSYVNTCDVKPWRYTTVGFSKEVAARIRLALVRDDTSPDGWRLVDLDVTP